MTHCLALSFPTFEKEKGRFIEDARFSMHCTRIRCCSVFEVWFSTRLCAKVPHLLWVTKQVSLDIF